MSGRDREARRARLRRLARQFPENGMKLLLENPMNVRDLLALTGSEVVEAIDFDRMRRLPTTFVTSDYAHVEADVVLAAPLRPTTGDRPVRKRITIYILIEHQSRKDRLMPFRLVDYVVQLYRFQIRRWSERHRSIARLRLQPVQPVVFHTGTRRWDRIGTVTELVEEGERIRPAIPESIPLVLNLPALEPAALERRGGIFGWVLRLVQERESRPRRFKRQLVRVVRHLEGMPPEDRRRWIELLFYIRALVYHARGPAEQSDLEALIERSAATDETRQEVYTMSRTMADVLREEGREEGRVADARATLLRLLGLRFGGLPETIVSRVEATGDLEQLNTWLDRFATATTLEEIGISSRP